MTRLNRAKAVITIYGSLIEEGERLTTQEKDAWKQARIHTATGIDDQASWEAACDLLLVLCDQAEASIGRDVFELSEAAYKPLMESAA